MMFDILEAREEHIQGLLAVFKEFLDFHGDLEPVYIRRDDAHVVFAGGLRECIASEDHQVLVAVEDGDVVGYSLVGIGRYPPVLIVERFGFVSDLAVTASHRRRGIGTALMERNLDWFRSKGLDRVELRVLARNDAAYRFWNAMGFSDYIHRLYLGL